MMVILTQNETLMQFQHYRIHIALAAVAVVRTAADGRLLTKCEQFCATVYIAMVKFWKRNINMFTGAYSTKWRNSCKVSMTFILRPFSTVNKKVTLKAARKSS
jgi:hypothetical protein